MVIFLVLEGIFTFTFDSKLITYLHFATNIQYCIHQDGQNFAEFKGKLLKTETYDLPSDFNRNFHLY